MTARKKKTALAPKSKTKKPSAAALLHRIREIWNAARSHAARSVNTAHVSANWLIGQQIVEAEQSGKARAEYGKQLLWNLSKELNAEFGEGFSLSALKNMRSFYLGYPGLLEIGYAVRGQLGTRSEPTEIGHALRSQLPEAGETADTAWKPGRLHGGLSWTHYRALLKVERRAARDFYEIEAVRAGWSARQLERQIHSLLFERLRKSRDKAGVLALANEGQVAARPQDAIKDPYVLEFLDLPAARRLVETRVEEALISRLHDFLLELGSGFAFVGRQKRLTLESDHFYPDLVFYHVKLKCYVVIDLKVDKLTHGDLGQMLMYVNYYDREIVGPGDQPTIGLILCADKNESMVRYVLDEKSKRIFASRYKLQLPSEEELRAELRRELDELQAPEVKP
jgi:predicted nuclease of restriction endonuclease-like (RecB) superfamily